MNSYEQERDRNSVRSFPYPQMKLLVRHSDVMPGLPFQHFQFSQDAKTIIQKLMHSSKLDKNKQSSSRKQIYSNHSQSHIPLESTQIKIFNQVINLLDQIDALKKDVAHEQAQMKRLQVERSQYSSKSNQKQIKLPSFSELQKQRYTLTRKLKKIQARKMGGLHKMLKQQRQRYQSLKKQMYKYTKISASNDDQIEIQSEKIRLKQANESLRVRIQLLRNTESYRTSLDDEARKIQLLENVAIEQQNKYAFLTDLDKFRTQYQELLAQNKDLQKRLNNKLSSKLQFSPKKYQRRVNSPKEATFNKKSQQLNPFKVKTQNDNTQSYISKQKTLQWRQRNGTGNLGQYVELVSQMKDILQN